MRVQPDIKEEIYYDEYKFILVEEINDKNLPVVYNINVGHSQPHCIIPLGIKCTDYYF